MGIEAGEEHVDLRATEGRVSVRLGARVRKGRCRGVGGVGGEALQCLPGEPVLVIGALVPAVVIGEATTRPAKAR